MKIFQKILILCLVLAILAVFVAICYRIYINEHFPRESTSIEFTEGLTAYYKKDPDGFAAYTRKIRVPVEDNKKGKFRADELIVVPDAGFLQVTLRYNEYILPILQEKYKRQSHQRRITMQTPAIVTMAGVFFANQFLHNKKHPIIRIHSPNDRMLFNYSIYTTPSLT